MSQHADESVDQDLLLAFSTEPGGKPPESAESLGLRVECLERALLRSESHVASLKSEVATLVSTVDDIKKISRRTASPIPPLAASVSKPRRTVVSAIAGAVLGIAIGVWGWTAWSSGAIEAIEPAPVAVQGPVAAEAPPPPVSALASATMPATATPDRDSPARSAPPKVRAATPTLGYVGTLSIDAAPGGEVLIDRKPAGRTPLRVSNLRAGSHLVWIERDGYRRWTQVVEVRSDRVSRVSASLTPLAAP